MSKNSPELIRGTSNKDKFEKQSNRTSDLKQPMSVHSASVNVANTSATQPRRSLTSNVPPKLDVGDTVKIHQNSTF